MYCQKTENPPVVRPVNGTHLEVSWAAAFTGCHPEHIDKIIIHEKKGDGYHLLKEGTFELQNSTAIAKNPCQRYQFAVWLKYNSHYHTSQTNIFSMDQDYNYESTIEKLYSGQMYTEVLSKMCVHENASVTFNMKSPNDILEM